MPRFRPCTLLLLSTLPLCSAATPTLLDADGTSPAYALVAGVLGAGNVEVPDCSHPEFGPHLTQDYDATLAAPVFVFHLHATPDTDRCLYTDRQRTEIKVSDSSPDGLKVMSGDTVFYRWRFRLDAGFQNSPGFTHLHQVRPFDGDAELPLVMLTSRYKDGTDRLELNHNDSAGRARTLATAPFAPLRGEWVEAETRLTAGPHGQYMLRLTRLSDGAVLLDYSNPDLDLWRKGTTFVRPKWGIYRSLQYPAYLRDEQVRLARFCLAKGSDECRPATEAEAPVFTPAGGHYTSAQQVVIASATPGVDLRYTTGPGFPTCSSGTPYAAPLTVGATTTLHAIACRADLAPSALASALYDFAGVRLALPRSAATASSNGDKAGYTLDGRSWTRWSASGDGQWIQYDLGQLHTVTDVGIAWYKGGSRQYRFDLLGSSDGQAYQLLYSGQGSGSTSKSETYGLGGVPLRWLRIVGHGNSVDGSIAITETVVHAAP